MMVRALHIVAAVVRPFGRPAHPLTGHGHREPDLRLDLRCLRESHQDLHLHGRRGLPGHGPLEYGPDDRLIARHSFPGCSQMRHYRSDQAGNRLGETARPSASLAPGAPGWRAESDPGHPQSARARCRGQRAVMRRQDEIRLPSLTPQQRRGQMNGVQRP